MYLFHDIFCVHRIPKIHNKETRRKTKTAQRKWIIFDLRREGRNGCEAIAFTHTDTHTCA